MPRDGTIRNMYIMQNVTSGNGNAIVYTVRINDISTSLSISIGSTTTNGSDLTNTVSVFMGDKIDIEVTKVRLHNPMTAIAELNKMDHIYDEKPQYQDNRTYNILVQGDEARDRFSKLLEGKRPVEIEGEDEPTD